MQLHLRLSIMPRLYNQLFQKHTLIRLLLLMSALLVFSYARGPFDWITLIVAIVGLLQILRSIYFT